MSTLAALRAREAMRPLDMCSTRSAMAAITAVRVITAVVVPISR